MILNETEGSEVPCRSLILKISENDEDHALIVNSADSGSNKNVETIFGHFCVVKPSAVLYLLHKMSVCVERVFIDGARVDLY